MQLIHEFFRHFGTHLESAVLIESFHQRLARRDLQFTQHQHVADDQTGSKPSVDSMHSSLNPLVHCWNDGYVLCNSNPASST